ncbi:MAG: lytic transglycosylase domain-containing protein [Bacteroidota bacterium]
MKLMIQLLCCAILTACEQREQPQLSKTVKKPELRHFEIPDVPESIQFAGEKLTLDKRDLIERFDRELIINNFWHSNTILFMKRANRWFPEMREVFKAHDVPEDLIYISIVESGLMQVRSPAGARGFWQLMPETARQYGLIVNGEIDERLHVKKSTRVACQYLRNAYEELDSWLLAAAAYNRGVRGIKNALEHQAVKNYADLHLNAETHRYVFRILAVKLIMKNPEQYGFNLSREQMYPARKVREVEVIDDIDDLVEWSKKNGVLYKTTRQLNPWIRQSYLKVRDGDTLKLILPEESNNAITSAVMKDTIKNNL